MPPEQSTATPFMSTVSELATALSRPILLGGIDGVITSFAVVAGGDAGSLDVGAVLVIGASSVVADGFSMGVSEYTSVEGEAERPMASSLACFASFVSFGIVPIAAYVATNGVLLSCIFFSLAELIFLGVLRTRIGVHRSSILRSAAQTAALGSASGAVAYAVGALAKGG